MKKYLLLLIVLGSCKEKVVPIQNENPQVKSFTFLDQPFFKTNTNYYYLKNDSNMQLGIPHYLNSEKITFSILDTATIITSEFKIKGINYTITGGTIPYFSNSNFIVPIENKIYFVKKENLKWIELLYDTNKVSLTEKDNLIGPIFKIPFELKEKLKYTFDTYNNNCGPYTIELKKLDNIKSEYQLLMQIASYDQYIRNVPMNITLKKDSLFTIIDGYFIELQIKRKLKYNLKLIKIESKD